MIIHPYTGIAVVPYTRIKEQAEWFKTFLAKNKITIDKKSILNEAMEIIKNLVIWQYDDSKVPANLDTHGAMSKAIGFLYLISAIRKASSETSFNKVKKLLPELAKENPLMTMRDKSTKPRNLSFELETACLFISTGIEAESKEPDVVLNYNGEKWNLPCKMIYSQSAVTLADRIEEGIEQMLRYDSSYGMVVLGLSNRIDHSSFIPILDDKKGIYGSFIDQKQAERIIRAEIELHFNQIKDQGKTRFDDGKKTTKFRGIMIVAHTTCVIGKTFSILTGVGLVQRYDLDLPKLVEGPEYRLSKRFNDIAQKIITE